MGCNGKGQRLLPTTMSSTPLLIALICALHFHSTVATASSDNSNRQQSNAKKTYIVYLSKPDHLIFSQHEDMDTWYQSFMASPAASVKASSPRPSSNVLYSYHNVITGFAARLWPEELEALEKKDGFLMARPERELDLHTTRSPAFLGLRQDTGFWKASNYGEGVIIGVLDTGIYVDHPSFNDKGMPPPPVKWKGKCEFTGGLKCNNKVIGARNFRSLASSPMDEDGHGTHTAGTAAGNFFGGASVYGNANGTAVGIAPRAHLSIYKVCSIGCGESEILAAMDAAIDDGVDVLSISLGGTSEPFYGSSIAVGAFSAMEKGVFVSCSAGNRGPFVGSLSNEAPWFLTVGAGTIDRAIRATALLGNKRRFHGESLFQPKDFPPRLLPLVYAGNSNDFTARFCGEGSLNSSIVKGKVVLCESGGGVPKLEKGQTVKNAGGAAMILVNQELTGYSISAEPHVLPATHVSYAEGMKIKEYINSTSSPTATILFEGTIIGVDHAPMVSSFSSRGPNRASPGILKPDIVGPGVSILAAWPSSVENNTSTKSTFNMISGTSMSCPHLSGVAALLKSAHPDWSPAAIKSAIMTTADLLDNRRRPIVDERLLPADMLALGSGHVNPWRAADPGLVYDLQPNDYIPYLCGLNYTDRQIGIITQKRVRCSQESIISEAQLNYPSFSITLGSTAQTLSRTVTNVGLPKSTYVPQIVRPTGVSVSVSPQVLVFTQAKQKITYRVTFRRTSGHGKAAFSQGYLKWVSPKHVVKTPILVKWP